MSTGPSPISANILASTPEVMFRVLQPTARQSETENIDPTQRLPRRLGWRKITALSVVASSLAAACGVSGVAQNGSIEIDGSEVLNDLDSDEEQSVRMEISTTPTGTISQNERSYEEPQVGALATEPAERIKLQPVGTIVHPILPPPPLPPNCFPGFSEDANGVLWPVMVCFVY